MADSDSLPRLGDLVSPRYYRVSVRGKGLNTYGTIVRRRGIFFDILWGDDPTPQEYWTTDDFYVVKNTEAE